MKPIGNLERFVYYVDRSEYYGAKFLTMPRDPNNKIYLKKWQDSEIEAAILAADITPNDLIGSSWENHYQYYLYMRVEPPNF